MHNLKLLSCFIILGVVLSGLNSPQALGLKLGKANNNQTAINKKAVIVNMKSDKLEYFEEKNLFVATGNAKIYLKDKDASLEAGKITFDQDKNTLVAEDKVKIIKNGNVIHGNFAKVDLTKESALIDHPDTVILKVKISAEKADIYPKSLILSNGKLLVNNEDLKLTLTSNVYVPEPLTNLGTEKVLTAPEKQEVPSYKISAKEVNITCYANKNQITLKRTKFKFGKFNLATVPSLKLSTDKELKRVETMLPVIGRSKELGGYVGPSYVFSTPFASTLKLAPLFGFAGNEAIGLGGYARFMNATNQTEVAYTTSGDKVVVEGEQDLWGKNTKILYGSNSYIDNGFFGKKKPKYIAEIVDDRLLSAALNFNLFLRSSAGYAQDYARDFGTGRFQMQSTLINDKPIFKIKDEFLEFRLVSQGQIAAYGNGDTFGLVRVGPNLRSNLADRLRLSTTYFQAATYGDSPFLFDRYNQGKSSVIIREEVDINKSFSLGHLAHFNITEDNWESRFATENQFYVKVGSEDFKFKMGYDIVRRRSLFGFDMLMGSGRTGVEFDKLKLVDKK